MFPSYQTVPLANVPTKANAPKTTPVPRMKKVAVAALVGMALVVVGYSYGASTIHPARMTDIATTTTTTTAANLVRGGVRTGDTSFVAMEKEDCYRGPCNKNRGNKEACLSGLTEGCHRYPLWGNAVVPGGGTVGGCSRCSGVDCGNGHRAATCALCPSYAGLPVNTFTEKFQKFYCNEECKWGDENVFGYNGRCVPKLWTGPPTWSF